MRRRPNGVVPAAAGVLLVLGAITACGGGGQLSHRAPAVADVPVTVAHGATVRLAGGTTLMIPPGAVTANGRLIGHADDAHTGIMLTLNGGATSAVPVLTSGGNQARFELTGAKLIHPGVLS
jgi:hypothetical protein